jgi:hypothetical protein
MPGGSVNTADPSTGSISLSYKLDDPEKGQIRIFASGKSGSGFPCGAEGAHYFVGDIPSNDSPILNGKFVNAKYHKDNSGNIISKDKSETSKSFPDGTTRTVSTEWDVFIKSSCSPEDSSDPRDTCQRPSCDPHTQTCVNPNCDRSTQSCPPTTCELSGIPNIPSTPPHPGGLPACPFMERLLDRHGEDEKIEFDVDQLEQKYRQHADAWGFDKNYNFKKGQAWKQTLTEFVQKNPDVVKSQINFRGNEVIIHVDPKTRLMVMTDLNANFVTAYQLNPDQFFGVLVTGKLGGSP